MTNHRKLYNLAHYYDIAFDFRDIPGQCDFLTEVYHLFSDKQLEACLELAAGPAYHAIEFAQRGIKTTALDLSPEMVAYGLQKAGNRGVSLSYMCQNMIEFSLDKQVDLAFLLLDSASYLLNNKSVHKHFKSVARGLNPGGIYILEMSHPKDVFRVGKTTANDWTMNRGDVKIHIQWGHEDDYFDPITQIANVTARLEVEDGGKKEIFVDRAWQKCFTLNEFRLLVETSPYFDLKAVFGDLDIAVSITHEKAWRTVAILQAVKKPAHRNTS